MITIHCNLHSKDNPFLPDYSHSLSPNALLKKSIDYSVYEKGALNELFTKNFDAVIHNSRTVFL